MRFGMPAIAILGVTGIVGCSGAQSLEWRCRLGGSEACHELGNVLRRGEGVAKDSDRALELWQRACEKGVGGACYDLRR
jgi:TPR repeat protein